MNQKTVKYIEELLNKFEIKDYTIDKNEVSISSSCLIGLMLHIHTSNKNIDFYYTIRTGSWCYSGERSDLHDVISIAFASFMKFSDLHMSCSLINIINPAIPELKHEIYARIIVPIQYDFSCRLQEDKVEGFLSKLIFGMFLFESVFAKLMLCSVNCIQIEKFHYSFKLTKGFTEIIDRLSLNKSTLNTAKRNIPCWEYIGRTKQGLSIIKSKSLISFFSVFTELIDKQCMIKGINGDLYVTKEYKNFISKKDLGQITSILSKFGDKTQMVFPIENKIIVVGHKICIFKDSFCDFQAFKNEKELIKERHDTESKILFPPEKIIWAEKIDEGRFELLIKELLERHEEVRWIRNTGHVNEPDGGRDLIAEWLIKPSGTEIRRKGEETAQFKRIIIQCKAYQGGVGKSDVQDIRDTIEHNNCQGYFLAVSSYLKRSLTEQLEKLRYSRNFWIDWWTRDEIETMLIENIDIGQRFPDIITL